eukprot:GFUD01105919.1.p1 GENE.GFUD01105919.1~~GFUD01105919.1.p1  ORF type:complete len:149 (+),score=33.79 GFUD01105919.1:57-503(+)
MKSEKENVGLISRTKKKIGSLLRAKSIENDTDYYYERPSYLESLLLPPILSVLLPYLDTISITQLEQCCHLLRHTVVSTREYRRRVHRMMSQQYILTEEEEDKHTDMDQTPALLITKLLRDHAYVLRSLLGNLQDPPQRTLMPSYLKL